MWAAIVKGDVKEVKQYLALGEDVNLRGLGNMTPLHQAAQDGGKEMVELLIENGADANAITDSGKTPLDCAIKNRHVKLYPQIRKHGGKTSEELEAAEPVAEASRPTPTAKAPDISIHKAAGGGNLEAVKQHLVAGADVNAKHEDVGTPLLYAAFKGCREVTELLIAEGADVNAKDILGKTPLDWTESQGHKETADLLRKHGGKKGEELKADGK